MTGDPSRYVFDRRIRVDEFTELLSAKLLGVEGFERPVAIRRLLPEHADDPAADSRLTARATAAAALRHSNLVGVLSVERDEASHVLVVLDRFDSVDLGTLLAHGPVSVPIALHVAGEILRGLAQLHEADLTHGDLTPADVLVGPSGSVKIVPFSIAPAGTGDTRRADLAAVAGILGAMVSARAAIAGDIARVRSRLIGNESGPYPVAAGAVAEFVAARGYPRAGTELVAALLGRRFPGFVGTSEAARGRRRGRLQRRMRWVAVLAGIAGLGGAAWKLWPDGDRAAPATSDAGADTFIADPTALGRAIGAMVDDSLLGHSRQCVRETGTEAIAFQTTLDIDPDGTLRSVVTTPSNEFTRCMERDLRTLRFPSSPSGMKFDDEYRP